YYDNLSFEKAGEVAGKLDRLAESPVAWYKAKVAARRGDFEAILAEYRRQIAESPKDPQPYLRLASTLADLARYAEARELLERVIALDPVTFFFLHREIGDLWAREGAFDKAGERWKQVLDIPLCDRRIGFGKHYDVRTERFLAAREGDRLGPALQDKFKVNAEEIVKGAPGQDRYPKASSVTLFLQYIVRFTGEDLKHAEHTSHHFIKIMNKKGGERYGRISTGQSLEECRVYTPDGKILEADGVQERGNLAMPELDAGAILEMKRVYSTNVPFDMNNCVRQLFKSPWLKFEEEPILKARLAIIIPSAARRLLPAKEALEVATGLPPKFFLRSSHMPVEARVEEGEGYVVYVYDLNDLEDIVAEPFMPPADEVLPYVSVFQWPFDAGRMLRIRRSAFADRHVNRNVREKALELTQSLPDPIAKLKRIYEFVVTEIKDGTQDNPSQTLIEKQGPSLDLFIAMARGIGFEADHALVIPPVTGPCAQEEWEIDGPPFAADLAAVRLPSDAAGDGTTTEGLPAGCWVGKDWLFVSVSQFSLFRAIPPALEGGKAVVFHRGGATIVDLPARCPLDLKGVPFVTVEILGDGKATVKGELPIPSFQSAQMRVFVEQNMGEEQRLKMFQRLAARLFPGINISSSEMAPFDPFDIGLRFRLEGSTSKFTTPTESGWQFRPALPALELSKVFTGQKKRVFPLRISQALASFCLQERLRVIAPAGYEIVPPLDAVLLTPFGSYSMRFVKSTAPSISDQGPDRPEEGAGEEPAASDENAGGGTEPTSTSTQRTDGKVPPGKGGFSGLSSGQGMVEVERSLLLYNQDIEPDDFEKFMAFLKAIDQIERRQVEVRRR
ncbi:MAG: tetratricopeptide repeat protein, partial [Planctomycetota bacterium]|nr:tetratricopeptide repeat protein [Planctomycetota bacterium]